MKKSIFGLMLGLCLLSGIARADEALSIAYVCHTGNRFIVFDATENHVSYQGTPNVKEGGDLGGEYGDCSTDIFLCASIAGHKIAVPTAGDLPSEWNLGPAHFSVLQTLTGGDHKVWLVSVMEAGDTYMYFSYSRERGVETLSQQMDGAPAILAQTYFLLNKRGLLSPKQ